MSSFRKLGRDIVVYGVMGGMSRGVNLLLVPILTRHFSPDEYGVIDIIATMSSLLAVVISLNLESAIARLWSESVRDKQERTLISSILALILSFGLVIVVCAYFQSARLSRLLLRDQSTSSYVALGATAALLSALSTVPQLVLRMQRRIVQYNVLSLVQTVSYISAALLLVFRFQEGLLGVFLAQVLGGSIALVAGLAWISPSIGMSVSWATLKPALHYSLPMLPAIAASWVNNQADRLMLLTFLGLGAVGLFGAASKVALVMTLIVGTFQQAWLPLSIQMIDDPIRRNDFYTRALTYYAGATSAVALMFVAFSRDVLSLLAPLQYRPGYVVIPWLLGAQILQGSAAFTNVGMLISRKTFGNSIAAWCGASVNVGLCFLLIPRFGIWGAAIGAFLAALTFTCFLWRYSLRVIDIRFNLKALLSMLTAYILACCAMVATYEFARTVIQSVIVRCSILIVSLCAIAYWTLDAPARSAISTSVRRRAA